MKIKKIVYFTIATFSLFTMLGCSNKNDLSVAGFYTNEKSYKVGEVMNFTASLNNPNNYVIESATISSSGANKSFTLKANTKDYSTYSFSKTMKGEDITYDGALSYTLDSLNYYDSNSNYQVLEVNQSININSNSNKDISGISLTSITVENTEKNESDAFVVSAGHDIDLTLNFDNENEYRLFTLDFTFENDEGETEKVSVTNQSIDTNVVKCSLKVPDFYGPIKLSLTNVQYLDSSQKTNTATITANTVKLYAEAVGSELLSLSLSLGGTYETETYIDRNEDICVRAGETVYCKAVISNPDRYDVSDFYMKKNDTSETKVTINKQVKGVTQTTLYVSFTTTDSKLENDDFYVTKYSLKSSFANKITYTVSDSKQEKTKVSFKTYKRVVENVKQLKTLIDGGTTLDGTTLIVSDTALDFSGYTPTSSLNLDGYLQFNCKIANLSTSTPLFNTISKNSVLEGLNLSTGCKFTNNGSEKSFLCKENNGTIQNVKLDNLTIVQNCFGVRDPLGLVLPSKSAIIVKNNGKLINMSIQNVYYEDLIATSATFSKEFNMSTVVYENTGTISNVAVSYASFQGVPGRLDDYQTNLFITKNSGTVQNCWTAYFGDVTNVTTGSKLTFDFNNTGSVKSIYCNDISELDKSIDEKLYISISTNGAKIKALSDVNSVNKVTATTFWESLGFNIGKTCYKWTLNTKGITLCL